MSVAWDVDLHGDFVPEFEDLAEAVQDELLAHVAVLEVFGPLLGRPRVDTVHGSRHANMKELRFDALMASGASPSRSTRNARESCCAAATSLVAARSASTGSSSRRPMTASTLI